MNSFLVTFFVGGFLIASTVFIGSKFGTMWSAIWYAIPFQFLITILFMCLGNKNADIALFTLQSIIGLLGTCVVLLVIYACIK